MNPIVDIPKPAGNGLNIVDEWEPAADAASAAAGPGLLAADDGRRPDPHARRNNAASGWVCGHCGTPLRDFYCPECRRQYTGTQAFRKYVPGTADASDPAPPTLGELASGSPYIPDAPADPMPPATAHDWLSDAGRCELAAVYPLIARMQRECPGVCVRVAVSFAVSGLADGTGHTDVRPGWELAAWRGTASYSGRGHDLEQLAAFACARIGGGPK